MEIFPTSTIESKLDVLEPGSYVAITCSHTRGVEPTLGMAERLAARGFRIIPHLAARMVRDRAHLRDIIDRLNHIRIESLFVPGGDAEKPAGKYECALQLLRDIAELDHRFADIGVAAHPEGHPNVSDEVLLEQLSEKQQYANYLVTQMCFDPRALTDWNRMMREHGIHLPVWLGIPGAAERRKLITTGLRIGVGDSLRFLRKQGRITAALMGRKLYRPDRLLADLAPYLTDAELNIRGFHIFCFNLVEESENWRRDFLARLEA